MVIDAATFAVIAVVLVAVVRPRYRLPRAAHDRWLDSFTDGMSYLRGSATARIFVIGLTALNVFVTPVVALGLALRVDGSHWGPHWLGLADGALAAGAIVGSLVAIRWQPTYPANSGFRVLVVQGLGLAVVGLPARPAVLLGMAVVGVTAGLASVWLSAAFLKAIDPPYTGRVSSVTSLGDMALMSSSRCRSSVRSPQRPECSPRPSCSGLPCRRCACGSRRDARSPRSGSRRRRRPGAGSSSADGRRDGERQAGDLVQERREPSRTGRTKARRDTAATPNARCILGGVGAHRGHVRVSTPSWVVSRRAARTALLNHRTAAGVAVAPASTYGRRTRGSRGAASSCARAASRRWRRRGSRSWRGAPGW